jgi:hypothetical protein
MYEFQASEFDQKHSILVFFMLCFSVLKMWLEFFFSVASMVDVLGLRWPLAGEVLVVVVGAEVGVVVAVAPLEADPPTMTTALHADSGQLIFHHHIYLFLFLLCM